MIAQKDPILHTKAPGSHGARDCDLDYEKMVPKIKLKVMLGRMIKLIHSLAEVQEEGAKDS